MSQSLLVAPKGTSSPAIPLNDEEVRHNASDSPSVASGSFDEREICDLEHGEKRLLLLVGPPRRVVDRLRVIREQAPERLEVPRGDCCFGARGIRGRGVRAYAAHRGSGREFLEAREGLACGGAIEVFEVPEQAVAVEAPDLDELAFEHSTAHAIGAAPRPPRDEPVAAQREQLVDAGDDLLGHVEQHEIAPPHRVGPAGSSEAELLVIDELQVRREDRSKGGWVPATPRTAATERAVAAARCSRGTIGQELGVQPYSRAMASPRRSTAKTSARRCRPAPSTSIKAIRSPSMRRTGRRRRPLTP